MDVLSLPALVLNKNWTPIRTISVRSAMTMLFGLWRDPHGRWQPKSRVLDVNDWQLYEWEKWIELPVKEGDAAINSAGGLKVRVPEIIVVGRYQRIPRNQLNFSKRNLERRDDCHCQYCYKKVSGRDVSIDHVVPRSRGGKNTWENCVVSCFACNQKKRDRTPEEADMELFRKPQKPGLEIIGNTNYRCKSWDVFFRGEFNGEAS